MLNNFKSSSFEQIAMDAKERGEEACKFLRSLVEKEIEVETSNKEGETVKEKKKSNFLAIKRAYFKEYYPDLLPKAKPKQKTMDQIMKDLGF